MCSIYFLTCYFSCYFKVIFIIVVDFFYFELIDFPIFNVADIYVTCATIILALLILFYYKEDELDCLFPKKKEKR